MNNKRDFGQHLRTLRKEQFMTQSKLANKSGLKLNHISKLERNEVEPKLTTLIKLKQALKISSNKLMNEADKSTNGDLIKRFDEVSELPETDIKTIIRIMSVFTAQHRTERFVNGEMGIKEISMKIINQYRK